MSADANTKTTARFNWLPFKVYGIAYAVLIVLFLVCWIFGRTEITTGDWVKEAFPGRKGDDDKSLAASMDKEAALRRVNGSYTFTASSGATVVMAQGTTINELQAVELAKAVIADQKAGKQARFGYSDLEVWKKGDFWNLPWPSIFTYFNLIGLLGALYFGLKSPVASALDKSAQDTSQALSQANDAFAEEAKLKENYEKMLADLEAEKERLADTLAEEEEIERQRIMAEAKHEAEGIVESVKMSIDNEISQAAQRLRKEVAKEALAVAGKALAESVSSEEHETALNEMVADLEEKAAAKS